MGIGNQSGNEIDHEIAHAAMTGVLDWGVIFKLADASLSLPAVERLRNREQGRPKPELNDWEDEGGSLAASAIAAQSS